MMVPLFGYFGPVQATRAGISSILVLSCHTTRSPRSLEEQSPRNFPQRRLLSQVSQPVLGPWVVWTLVQKAYAFKMTSAWHRTPTRPF